VCLLFSIGSSIYTMTQAVNPFRGGVNRPGDNRPQCSTAIPKCLPATTVPRREDLLPAGQSQTMPSLSAKSTRQDPCQVEKIFCLGSVDPTFTAGDSTKCARTREYNANLCCNYARIQEKNIDSEPRVKVAYKGNRFENTNI